MIVERWPLAADNPLSGGSETRPIRLPEAPAPERSAPISIVVLFAPAAIAVVMYLIIGSPYVLMFAVFSPLLALAGVLDRRIFGRRRMRARRQSFEAEVEVARAAIDEALNQRRKELEQRFPSARQLAEAECGQRLMFRPPGVVLGWAAQASGLSFSGGQPDSDELLLKLRASASVLEDAPVAVHAGRIVVHPGPTASNLDGVLRALYVSASACAGVSSVTLHGLGAECVIRELVNHGYEPDEDVPAQVEIQVSDEPNEDSVVARIGLQGAGFARCSLDGGPPTFVRLGVVGATEFSRWLGSQQLPEGQRANRLPAMVNLRDIYNEKVPESDALPCDLTATFAMASDAPFPIDLIADGPHALVAGTTGSGKSELLISWACALAARHNGDTLQLLCLDFKGGATFDVLATLPHCAGVITDLDGDEAVRVSASLLSEVRRREHALREAGVRDLAEYPGLLPRLVILVDEYQALLAAHPQLQTAFADVAARGRSLGMHLVLCTQRPGGVFRDALLANATLRLCLRVEEAFDSMVLLGTDGATKLPSQPRGRLLVRHGGETALVQVALSDESFIERIGRATKAPNRTVTKLWHPSLPPRLSRAALRSPEGTIPVAMADLPEEQAQPTRWLKPGDAPFAILGMTGSGRTTTMQSIAEGAQAAGCEPLWVTGDVEQTWDALQQVLVRTCDGRWPAITLVDDLDQRLAAFEPEYRAEFMAKMLELAREHRVRNCTLVVSLHESGGEVARLVRMSGSILRLSHTTRQAWTLSGGESQDWQAHWPPGRGRLERELVQVALPTGQDRAQAPQARGGSVLSEPSTGNSYGGLSPATHHNRPVDRAEIDGFFPQLSESRGELAKAIAVVTRDVGSLSLLLTDCGKLTAALSGAPGPSRGGMTPSPSTGGAKVNGVTAVDSTRTLAGDERVIIAEPEQWQAKFGLLAEYARSGRVLVHGVTPGEYRSLFRGDPLPPPLTDRRTRAWLRSPSGEVRRVSVQ